MKEFVISEAKTETAVLVGLITAQQDEAKTKEYLDELEFLADTAGAKVVKRFMQRVGGPSAVTYVGSGKLQEIKEYIKQQEDAYDEARDHVEDYESEADMPQPVGMVIFDDELTAKQLRNIEKELQVKILDRTSGKGPGGAGAAPLYAAPPAASVDTLGTSGRRLRQRRWQGLGGLARPW